jgi:hypothetical protein
MRDDHFGDDGDLTGIMEELDSFESDNMGALEESLLAPEQPAGIMSVAQALASNDPLENIRKELVPANHEQRLFIDVYSALLDLNSAGISILFDRRTFPQLNRLKGYLKEIGADKTRASLEEIMAFIVSRLGQRPDAEDLFDLVGEEDFESMARTHDLDSESMVDEMERRLLQYARKNLNRLKRAGE